MEGLQRGDEGVCVRLLRFLRRFVGGSRRFLRGFCSF